MDTALPSPHLQRLQRFYDQAPIRPGWAGRHYRRLLAHYFNLHLTDADDLCELGCGDGDLLGRLRGRRKVGVDLSSRHAEAARRNLPGSEIVTAPAESAPLQGPFDKLVISDTLNLVEDVQGLLQSVQRHARPETRLLLNFHSGLWRPVLGLARRLGLASRGPENSWLSTGDVLNLLELAGWQALKVEPRILLPLPLLGLDRLVNRWLAPLLPACCLTVFVVARPRQPMPERRLSVSVVVPARNEAGNIADAVKRIPEMGNGTEIIFVEGGSSDDTWQRIEQVVRDNPERNITILRQTARGKGNAVREGFAKAAGDILMILDADLTVPPEDLPKFYAAIANNQAEFANGVRLVYPMEDQAMRFLNMCANKFFGLSFSWLLGQPIKDTLCGTKVLTRANYERLAANRRFFGEFDPFGDFDLLFGAAKLDLRIVDIPIRYRQRTYGDTNIHRWRHGWLLLRMVMYAARKLKFV